MSLSRLRIPEDRAPELIEAFRRRAHLVDHADGFIDLQVWQADVDPAELIMVSWWREREAFVEYMRSAEHKASHARIDSMLKDVITLERLEHLHTYEVVSE